MVQCSRVLKPGGYFFIFTYGQPQSRLSHLEKPKLNWKVTFQVIGAAPLSPRALPCLRRSPLSLLSALLFFSRFRKEQVYVRDAEEQINPAFPLLHSHTLSFFVCFVFIFAKNCFSLPLLPALLCCRAGNPQRSQAIPHTNERKNLAIDESTTYRS